VGTHRSIHSDCPCPRPPPDLARGRFPPSVFSLPPVVCTRAWSVGCGAVGLISINYFRQKKNLVTKIATQSLGVLRRRRAACGAPPDATRSRRRGWRRAAAHAELPERRDLLGEANPGGGGDADGHAGAAHRGLPPPDPPADRHRRDEQAIQSGGAGRCHICRSSASCRFLERVRAVERVVSRVLTAVAKQ
jgi:hypothetical protein